jgi:anhydro-N-acetylmuramic acid kinase
VAKRYIASLAQQGIKVDLIASHGQTVRHLPQKVAFGGNRVNGTLQLGSLEFIAAGTGKVVTGDFRQADIALGNEGAPITVAAMALIFGHPKESRLIVNIGGIANYFYLPAGGRMTDVRAADCGPGNSLLDLLAQSLFNKPFDRGGQHAARGNVSQRLMSILTAHPFFKNRTVSTGREMFGTEMAQEMIAFGKKFSLRREDLLATAAEFTALAIADSVVEFVAGDARLKKIYLTGGGSRNRFIAGRLREHLDDIAVRSINELGVDADLVEASAYAVMGAMTVWSHPLQTKFTRGKRQAIWPVPGKIVQPPVRVK